MEEEEEDEQSGWNRVEIDETPVNIEVKISQFHLVYIEFILVLLCRKEARIRSWKQPVLSNESKVSCSRKQRLAPD